MNLIQGLQNPLSPSVYRKVQYLLSCLAIGIYPGSCHGLWLYTGSLCVGSCALMQSVLFICFPFCPSTRCLAGFTGHRCEQAVLKKVSDPKRMWTQLYSIPHVIAGVSPCHVSSKKWQKNPYFPYLQWSKSDKLGIVPDLLYLYFFKLKWAWAHSPLQSSELKFACTSHLITPHPCCSEQWTRRSKQCVLSESKTYCMTRCSFHLASPTSPEKPKPLLNRPVLDWPLTDKAAMIFKF